MRPEATETELFDNKLLKLLQFRQRYRSESIAGDPYRHILSFCPEYESLKLLITRPGTASWENAPAQNRTGT